MLAETTLRPASDEIDDVVFLVFKEKDVSRFGVKGDLSLLFEELVGSLYLGGILPRFCVF